MATNTNATNQYQPTEFEARRAELVGQIGEVSQILEILCNTRELFQNTRVH